MGVARKQQTFHVNETLPLPPHPLASSFVGRNLGKYQLGGVIFGCKNSTIKECLSKQLFGLPAQHFSYVKDIDRGLPLFLFNYSDRKLHGMFEAVGKGQMYIDPYAWTTDCSETTKYPAQVQMRVRLHCQALLEENFAQVIADNYFSRNHFWFELDHRQTSRLISLLVSVAFAPGISIPKYPMKRKNVSESLPSHGTLKKTEAFGMPKSEGHNFTQLRRREDSNAMTFLERDIQPMKTITVVEEENQDEKTLIYEKLKEFALSQESQNRSSPDIAIGSPDQNNMCSVEKMDATFEIQLLKDRCTMLESKCNLPLGLVKEIVTESSSKLQLDPKESLSLIGGSDGESQLASMDLYCPSKNVVKSRTRMSTASLYSSSIQLNGELYAFGGVNGNIWYDKVESYNPIHEMWTLFSSLSLKKESLAGFSLNNNIFVVGGGNGTVCLSELIFRFALAAMDLNGALYASGRYNGIDYFKYALGGYDGSTLVPSIKVFDFHLKAWMMEEQINHLRVYFDAANVKEGMYLSD
ncbi:hypothetical protein TanjilG_12809 [Lupinus angustifolius]|uniref:DCD domain-containing protein n=1 Tax=Lupinus angustifolius TaxID=3871 RepID=A0A1J7GKB2_LUPAN|nr:hypothetical protein TanjilG_12809 [Lupinus angustifolius]